MNNRIQPCAAAVLPFLLSAAAQAAPFLIYQDRSVCVQGCTQSQTVGTFIANRSSGGSSTAQHSNLSSCGIYAWMRAGGVIGGGGPSAQSVCNLAFGVTEPTEFILSFQSDVNTLTGLESQVCYFTLSADDTVVISAAGELNDTWSGTLNPGIQYLLQFFTRGQAGGPSGYIITRAEVIIQIGSPCPIPELICLADQSANGVVDLDDLAVVVQNWNLSFSPGTNGDANRDARVNLADIARIIAMWGEACVPQP